MKVWFEISGLPKMANGGHGHWRADYGQKKEWQKRVGSCLWGQIPKAPLKKAKAVFTRFSSMEPDDDGLVHGFKPIRDALKFYGVIVDDKRKCLTAEYRWERARPGQGKIRVEVIGE